MPPIVPEQARNDDKQTGQNGRRLQHADHTTCADALPRQAQYQRLELLAVEFDLTAVANAGPVKSMVTPFFAILFNG
ncbi:hypothetical protein HU761_26150 [Pseudomonas sp. SWRI59]|uniref:hypothetical protein n=1 Tax=Pseudomonas TaxID=286 RepID=UPI00164783BA|nr:MULTISPECIES: hypothetical protein [unclassified Pseudomonas]MBC3504865.1 hypothetical protein [Pseudomonas sp. SWRI59]MBC3510093.1 hypothetical protein [Pseudomonas sp. SWRI68]